MMGILFSTLECRHAAARLPDEECSGLSFLHFRIAFVRTSDFFSEAKVGFQSLLGAHPLAIVGE